MSNNKDDQLTQEKLAEIIGTGQAFVSLFLAGKKNCSVETAKKLSAKFGMSVEWWIKSTSEERQKKTGLKRRE